MKVSSGYLETNTESTLHYLKAVGSQKIHKTSIRLYVFPWFKTSAPKYMTTALYWAIEIPQGSRVLQVRQPQPQPFKYFALNALRYLEKLHSFLAPH